MMSILWRWLLTALRIFSHAWALYFLKHKMNIYHWICIYMQENNSLYSLQSNIIIAEVQIQHAS